MLADTIAAFLAARHDPALAQQVFGSSAPRVAVYANNTLFNRADALADAFPTVLQLVGDDFFGAMARAYARCTPSRSGDLHRYGATFADFIAQFAPAQDLPYLPDCARLDWLLHRAYYADNAPPFDFQRLASLAAQDETALRFRPHPATGTITSHWPIWRIWQAHREQDAAFPALDDGGDACLVWRRPDNRPSAQALNRSEWAFTASLLAGATLDTALQAALQHDENFQPGPTLNHLIGDQVLIDCYLENPP